MTKLECECGTQLIPVEPPPDLPSDSNVQHCPSCDTDIWIKDDGTRRVIS